MPVQPRVTITLDPADYERYTAAAAARGLRPAVLGGVLLAHALRGVDVLPFPSTSSLSAEPLSVSRRRRRRRSTVAHSAARSTSSHPTPPTPAA